MGIFFFKSCDQVFKCFCGGIQGANKAVISFGLWARVWSAFGSPFLFQSCFLTCGHWLDSTFLLLFSRLCRISSTNTCNHHQGQDDKLSITSTAPIPQRTSLITFTHTFGTLFQPLQLLYDWQFLQQSRDIVFPVFVRTVECAGRLLRASIIEELELPEQGRFTHFRLGNLYLREMWIQNGLQPFVVCTAPENTPPNTPRLATTFQEITRNQQRGIEPFVWEHLLVYTNHLNKILKQGVTIQSTRCQ